MAAKRKDRGLLVVYRLVSRQIFLSLPCLQTLPTKGA